MKLILKSALYLALATSPLVGMSGSVAADPTDTSISSGGDTVKGKRLFNRCRACHNLTATARTRIGPNLNDLFGRAAGKQEGYKYSKALGAAEFVWTEQNLDEWLAQPRTFLPGNKMAFAGLRKEQDRKDLMAYLREATIAAE